MKRTIIIQQADDGWYNVILGDRFSGSLSWDECLGVIAHLLVGGPASDVPLRGRMETIDEMEHRLTAEIRTEVERDLRPVNRLLLAAKRKA